MSVTRLLDEATLKGGYKDGYDMLNAMMTAAGFVKVDGGRIVDDLYHTHWKLPPVRNNSSIAVVLAEGHGDWFASINKLRSSTAPWEGATGSTPIEALVYAFRRASAPTPTSSRVQQFLTALEKLEVSPMRASMEAALKQAKLSEAVLRNGTDAHTYSWLNARLIEAGFVPAAGQQPAKLPDDEWTGKWRYVDKSGKLSRLNIGIKCYGSDNGALESSFCWHCYTHNTSNESNYIGISTVWENPLNAVCQALFNTRNRLRRSKQDPDTLDAATEAHERLLQIAQDNPLPNFVC